MCNKGRPKPLYNPEYVSRGTRLRSTVTRGVKMKSFIQNLTIRSLFSAASARRGIHEVIQFGWDMKNVR